MVFVVQVLFGTRSVITLIYRSYYVIDTVRVGISANRVRSTRSRHARRVGPSRCHVQNPSQLRRHVHRARRSIRCAGISSVRVSSRTIQLRNRSVRINTSIRHGTRKDVRTSHIDRVI